MNVSRFGIKPYSLGGLARTMVQGAVSGSVCNGVASNLGASTPGFMAGYGALTLVNEVMSDDDYTPTKATLLSAPAGLLGAGVGYVQGWLIQAGASLFPSVGPFVGGALGGAVVAGAFYLAGAGLNAIANS